MFRIFILFIFSFIFNAEICGQSYPEWFLFQDKISCDNISVGFASTGFIIDSTIVNAKTDAVKNLICQQQCLVAGGQGFWTTESGAYWLGSDLSIEYDTALALQKIKSKFILSSFHNKNITLVLIGDSLCSLPPQLKKEIEIYDIKKPDWVTKIPISNDFFFTVGESEDYFYEETSWRSAQQKALIELAKQKEVKLQRLQRQITSYYGEIIQNQELSVKLSDVKILRRWYDNKTKIYYVLAKAPKF